jgi:hypothetical protein
MIISYLDKAIFVHIPKTAGTSVSSALIDRATLQIKRHGYAIETMMYAVGTSLDGQKHLKYWELKENLEQDDFGKSVCRDFYSFAFVRNPWDRHVSFYHFMLQKSTMVAHDSLVRCGSFDKWVVQCYENVRNNHYVNFTHPQWSWTHIDGEQAIDFIGYYENLHDDFDIWLHIRWSRMI